MHGMYFFSVALLLIGSVWSDDGCVSKDSDYCEADAKCHYDYQYNRCEELGCNVYTDAKTCKADDVLYKVGPCTWSDEYGVCYKKDTALACDLHYFDCPRDQCQFNDTLGVCYDKGGSPPCYIFGEEAICNSDDCKFLNGACLPTLQAGACSETLTEDACTGKCAWNSEFSLCWPTALDIPCDRYSDGNSCPKERCDAVVVSDFAILCVEKDTHVLCDQYEDAGHCPSDVCAYNHAAEACYNPKIGIDCREFSLTDCPLDDCRRVNGLCLDPDEPIDCSSIYYLSSDCNADNNCQTDCDAQMCMPCEGDNCDKVTCPGATPDPNRQCQEVYTKPDCDAVASCEWSDLVHVCLDKGMVVPCEYFAEEGQCNNRTNCRWDLDYCVECIDEDCKVITTESPDSGAACNTYDVDRCPFPRCIYNYVDETTGECQPTQCRDLYNPTDCVANTSCSFSQDLYACYVTSEGLPCNYFSDVDQCGNSGICEWDAVENLCVGKDTGNPCNQYSLNECPGRCHENYDDNTCEDKVCADNYEEGDCKSPCTWSPEFNQCYIDTGKACSSYTSYADCPPTRCEFDYDTEADGECLEKGCTDFYDEQSCEAAGCTYKVDVGICYNDTHEACSAYPHEAVCPGDRCEWVSEDGSTFDCAEKVCSEFYDQDFCESANCTWDQSRYVCYQEDNSACSSHDDRDCPTNRCVFDYDTEKCRDYDCGDFFDGNECERSALKCDFYAQYGVCVPQGDQVPCKVWNFDQPECPSDRCDFADDVEACYPKGQQVPCESIYEEHPCNTRNYCVWDSATYRCAGKAT